MTQTLNAGVVGAGAFGGHHARKYAAMQGVRLVGVHDPDAGRAAALAESLGVRAFSELPELLDAAEIVTVATPATAHASAALAALNARRSVYVEKPLAASLDEADRLVSSAARAAVVLACGHQERAVFEAMGLLGVPERPLRLESVRHQPWSPRNGDVSCVLDLMIHDLDLALAIAGGEPVAVEGEGRTPKGPHLDAAEAEITLSDGSVLSLSASRVSDVRERRMRVVYPSGELLVDFADRTFENRTPFALRPDFAETAEGRDPLGSSVSAFVAAVRGERSRPLVTGEEAARALDLALAVERACGA